MAALSALTAILVSDIVPRELSSSSLMFIVGGVLFSSILFAILLARTGPSRSHNVAFIGFRRSGKTTLLATMFNELVLFKVSRVVAAELSGPKTIERVTRHMEKIKSRQAVGPTTRHSQFPYEVNITEKGLLRRSFKMSFGDFPGERSEEYVKGSFSRESENHDRDSEDYEDLKESFIGKQASSYVEDADGLFDSEFFRWILESDALIFVVDVARYLQDEARQARLQVDPAARAGGATVAGTVGENYVVEMTQAYIRTWSYIANARRRGGEVRDSIVVLAFTKSDLLDVNSEEFAHESFEATVTKLGFMEPLPEERKMPHLQFEEGKRRCERDFRDLIRFLKGNSRRFHAVYTSSFALMDDDDDKRLGVEGLFGAVLPMGFR